MADKSAYLENQDDQISAQKRAEQGGSGVASVLTIVATAAAVVLARRKIKLSQAFSESVKELGRSGEYLSRYAISEAALGGSNSQIKKFIEEAKIEKTWTPKKNYNKFEKNLSCDKILEKRNWNTFYKRRNRSWETYCNFLWK